MYGRPALRLVLVLCGYVSLMGVARTGRFALNTLKQKIKTYYYKYDANRVALQYVLFTAQ